MTWHVVGCLLSCDVLNDVFSAHHDVVKGAYIVSVFPQHKAWC